MNMNVKNIVDVAIIGAGPSGLFSVLEAGIFGMRSCIIDGNSDVGGQCTMLYPEKPIYDIPAHKMITGGDFIGLLRDQISVYKPKILLGETVRHVLCIACDGNSTGTGITDDVRDTDDSVLQRGAAAIKHDFQLVMESGRTIFSRAVVLAVGGGRFIPRRPEIDGVQHYEGKGIFYSIRNKSYFTGKKVVIAGGGDAAVDWAINLSSVVQKLYVVHRRETFRCMPESLAKLHTLASEFDGRVELVIPYTLFAVRGNADGTNNTGCGMCCDGSGGCDYCGGSKLSGVVVKNVKDGTCRTLEVDALIPCFGLVNDMEYVTKWGVQFSDEQRGVCVDYASMSTSVRGMYAIGDVAIYGGKIKSILSGMHEAARACRSIYSLLHPDDAVVDGCHKAPLTAI